MIYFNHQEKSQKRLILSQNFHLILVNIKLICLIILLGIRQIRVYGNEETRK